MSISGSMSPFRTDSEQGILWILSTQVVVQATQHHSHPGACVILGPIPELLNQNLHVKKISR